MMNPRIKSLRVTATFFADPEEALLAGRRVLHWLQPDVSCHLTPIYEAGHRLQAVDESQ
jgi:hypothetical protein